MKSMCMEYVSSFVGLQGQLINAFVALYPDATDFRWLLDFPKSGVVHVDGELWNFVKHGAGLRFVRESCEPYLVVDVHRCLDEPKAVDCWRLVQFFESCGKVVTQKQTSLLLCEMCSNGYLLDCGNGVYIFSE